MTGNNTKIENLTIHFIGNKNQQEPLFLSKRVVVVDDSVKNLLSSYFLNAFKSEEYYNFYHESDLNLNEVFVYISRIFENPNYLFDQSVNLAKHLYEKSNHPKIKNGEFYTVYFQNCVFDGRTVDAIGLFKSENKDTFLKIYPQDDGFEVEGEQGININKLDKGCLVFNCEKESGYIVSVVDNINRTSEALYWIDDFLHLLRRKDDFFDTGNMLSLCKNYITKEMPQEFEVSKVDQVDLLNKSVKFFKEKENFDMDEFTREVISQNDVIDSFKKYKSDYIDQQELDLSENFAISGAAVKKQSKNFKSVIKLDKNFHIYIHGDNKYIKKGFDEEQGLNYYQIFFKDEQ